MSVLTTKAADAAEQLDQRFHPAGGLRKQINKVFSGHWSFMLVHPADSPRPRDVPTRTALGTMAITFFLMLLLSGANDIIAFTANISLNAVVWAGRIALLVLPPLAYYLIYQLCLALQRADRDVSGSLYRPDPPEQTTALRSARDGGHR